MANRPLALTTDEINEIASLKAIQESWGATSAAEMEEILSAELYAVKFNYQSGSPGYVGDLFILQGDALGEPFELVRNKVRQNRFL